MRRREWEFRLSVIIRRIRTHATQRVTDFPILAKSQGLRRNPLRRTAFRPLAIPA